MANRRILLIALALLSFTCHSESHPYFFSNKQDETRFTSLTEETRCIVCQNQPLSESNAPLAVDMRKKIYHLILSHQSDDDIKDYLVKRYGEFILLRPRFNQLTVLLWLFPAGCLIAMIFIFRKILTNSDLAMTSCDKNCFHPQKSLNNNTP